MNSTTISLTIYLANIQVQIIRSLLTPIYIIGNLNNIINILIFNQNTLRSHICSWYFIGASIGHLLYLNIGCLTRVIPAWIQYDLTLISLSFCRARIYFILDGLTGSRYLFCLISIDRWMITSRNPIIRQLSSPKIARRLIIGGISFLFIINIFISVGYNIDKIFGCVGSTTPEAYVIFNTIHNTALSLVPLCISSIFSILMLFNILQSKHNVSPIIQTSTHQGTLQQQRRRRQRRRYRKKDIQFIKLALVQVVGYVLFNTLHGYNTIYEMITANYIKTANQQAINAFLYGMGLNLHYTYTGITFFLYTLASVTFRNECVMLFKRWLKHLLHLPRIQHT